MSTEAANTGPSSDALQFPGVVVEPARHADRRRTKPQSRSDEGRQRADQVNDEAQQGWIESVHFRAPEQAAIGETIPFAIAIALTDRIKDLKASDRQFDRDQNHNDDLQAQGPPGVDRVGEDLGGVGDNVEFAR